MTVIAYTKGVLAADTQGTTDDMKIRSQKIEHLKNGTVVGTAGDSDCREVLGVLGRASMSRMPSRASLIKTQTEFDGIWIFPDPLAIFMVSIEHEAGKWTAEIRPMLDDWAAVGAGAKYAAGAILAGKSAIDAVKIACRLDVNCGLPVESYKITSVKAGKKTILDE